VTAARALQAYGGEAVWKDAVTVESRVTVGGLLFQLKGVNIPAHAKITVDVQRPTRLSIRSTKRVTPVFSTGSA